MRFCACRSKASQNRKPDDFLYKSTCLLVGDTKPKDHVLIAVKLASPASFSVLAQLASSLLLRYSDPLQFLLQLVEEAKQMTRLEARQATGLHFSFGKGDFGMFCNLLPCQKFYAGGHSLIM